MPRRARNAEPKEKVNPDSTLTAAPEVGHIAGELVLDHHRRLLEAKILFLFTGKKPMRQGRPVMARTTKLSPLQRFLSTNGDPEEPRADFVVVVRRDSWGLLSEDGRKALVDHELEHCGFDDEADKWVLVPHDLEEFAAVVVRHGLWQSDVRRFADAIAPRLPGFDGAVEAEQRQEPGKSGVPVGV